MALYFLRHHPLLWIAVVCGSPPQTDCRILFLGAHCDCNRYRGNCSRLAPSIYFWFYGPADSGFCHARASILEALSALVAWCCHQRRRLFAVGRRLSAGSHAGCMGAYAESESRAVEHAEVFCCVRHDSYADGGQIRVSAFSRTARAKTELPAAEILKHHIAALKRRGCELSLP